MQVKTPHGSPENHGSQEKCSEHETGPLAHLPDGFELSQVAKKRSITELLMNLSYPLIEHGFMFCDRHVDVMTRILNSTEGRDKIFKALVSVLRIAEDWLQDFGRRYPNKKEWAKNIRVKMKRLQDHTSLTRNFLRLGNAPTFIRLAIRVSSVEKNPYLRFLVMGRFLGLAIYFLFDHLTWSIKVGLINLNRVTVVKLGLCGYLWSAVCTLLLDYYQLRKLRQRWHEVIHRAAAEVKSRPAAQNATDEDLAPSAVFSESAQEEINLLYEKHSQLMFNFLKNILDLLDALNGLLDLGFSASTRGWLGLISTWIAGQRMWERVYDQALAEKRGAGLLPREKHKKK